MALLPISLGVRRAPDTGEAGRKDRIPSPKETEKTLSRDENTCRCCGFTSKKFQRVLPLEAISAPAREDEFVTVCTFCEMCFALDRAGLTGAGVLIWLPELSQAELNHVVRAIYVAQASNSALAAAAKRTLEVLTARRSEAKKRLGTDDPLILATAFHESVDDATYAKRGAKIEGIRLLMHDRYFIRQKGTDMNVFPQMISYWTSSEGPFSKPVTEWAAMFDDVAKKTKEQAT